MPLTTTKNYSRSQKGGYAVGAFNMNNLEILQASSQQGSGEISAIIAVSEGPFNTGILSDLHGSNSRCSDLHPISLHLDHAKIWKSFLLHRQWIHLSHDRWVEFEFERTSSHQKVSRWQKKGISVEAELGRLKELKKRFLSLKRRPPH